MNSQLTPPKNLDRREIPPPRGSLRVLLIEPGGGKLYRMLEEISSEFPMAVEVEARVDSLTALAASRAFDVMIIGPSPKNRQIGGLDPAVLKNCAQDTPLLVLGDPVPGLNGSAAGSVQTAQLSELTSSVLMREIRSTLENHALAGPLGHDPHRLDALNLIFQHMLERMPEAVAVVDLDGELVALNQLARPLWDLPERSIGTCLVKEPVDGELRALAISGQKVMGDLTQFDWLGSNYFLATLRVK